MFSIASVGVSVRAAVGLGDFVRYRLQIPSRCCAQERYRQSSAEFVLSGAQWYCFPVFGLCIAVNFVIHPDVVYCRKTLQEFLKIEEIVTARRLQYYRRRVTALLDSNLLCTIPRI